MVKRRRRRPTSIAIAALFGTVMLDAGFMPVARAQSQVAAKPLAFDAVSIRPADFAGASRSEPGLLFLPSGVTSPPAGVTVRQLVTEAYQITEHQLAGGPSWINSDRFTLQAKADGRFGRQEIRLMLQTLLAERFKLMTSRGTKAMRVYGLVVRKDRQSPVRYQVKADSPAPTGFQKVDATSANHTTGRAIALGVISMEGFARALSELRGAQPGSPLLDRPVLDRTGLPGVFNLRLAWNDDGDFFVALQDELGLRLESQQADMTILSIDHIEKPTAN